MKLCTLPSQTSLQSLGFTKWNPRWWKLFSQTNYAPTMSTYKIKTTFYLYVTQLQPLQPPIHWPDKVKKTSNLKIITSVNSWSATAVWIMASPGLFHSSLVTISSSPSPRPTAPSAATLACFCCCDLSHRVGTALSPFNSSNFVSNSFNCINENKVLTSIKRPNEHSLNDTVKGYKLEFPRIMVWFLAVARKRPY